MRRHLQTAVETWAADDATAPASVTAG